MKYKFLYILMLAHLCSATTFAQDKDPWVGTWTSQRYESMDWDNSPKDEDGTYSKVNYAYYKKVFRITKDNDGYFVRGKVINVNNPNDCGYMPRFTVEEINGNTMYLRSAVKKDPWEESGRITEYHDYIYYHKLTLNNGVLHYSLYNMVINKYDRNMRYIGTTDKGTFKMDGDELDCFNDDW